MSEAARGYAAAIEEGYPEIRKLESQLQMLAKQIKNQNATHSGTKSSGASTTSPVQEFDEQQVQMIDLICQQVHKVLSQPDKRKKKPSRQEWGVRDPSPNQRLRKKERTKRWLGHTERIKAASHTETKVNKTISRHGAGKPKRQSRVRVRKNGPTDKQHIKRGKAPVSKRMGTLTRWSPAQSSSSKAAGLERLEYEGLVQENEALHKQVQALKHQQHTDAMQIARLKRMLAADRSKPKNSPPPSPTSPFFTDMKQHPLQRCQALLSASFRRESQLRQALEQKERDIVATASSARQTRVAELEVQTEEFLAEIWRLKTVVAPQQQPKAPAERDVQLDTLRRANRKLKEAAKMNATLMSRIKREVELSHEKIAEQSKALVKMAKRLRTMERVKNNAIKLVKSRDEPPHPLSY